MTRHVLEIRQTGRTAVARMAEIINAALTLRLSWEAMSGTTDDGKPAIVMSIADGNTNSEVIQKP